MNSTYLADMQTIRLVAITGGLVLAGLLLVAHAETLAEIRNRILTETRFNAVDAEDLPKAVTEYKGDGDPTTLELVIFQNESDGPSRVSDDGEVIFLYAKDSDQVQEELIQKAFEIRIARAAGGS